MEINKINKGMLICMFYALTPVLGYAGTMGVMSRSEGNAYMGVFGGAGASTTMSMHQFGTAFYLELDNGPLAVNAFGKAHSGTVGLVGGHVGYQWVELPMNVAASFTGLTPAVELEGYYLGKSKFNGHDINNETTRLTEHDFLATYPMNTGVFLVNAIANFNLSKQPTFHPYVGAGIGAGVLSISNATLTQTSPAEVGINHYNSNPNATDAVFAGQVKAGLSMDLSQHVHLFGEYRWLYLANSTYTFGSTVYPAHVATSPWLTNLGSQNYNLGVVGLRYSV